MKSLIKNVILLASVIQTITPSYSNINMIISNKTTLQAAEYIEPMD